MRLTVPETGALLSAFFSFALASDPLTLYLPAKPNPFTLPPSTHATLSSSGVHYSAPLSSANTFVFRNVTPGSYLADIHAPTDAFHPLRIDIQVVEGAEHDVVQAWETFRGNDWGNKGEVVPVKEGSKGGDSRLGRLALRTTLWRGRNVISVFSILKNPMILMALVSLVLLVGMPKLMDSMDPELRAEFEAQQKNSPMNAVMNAQASGENPLTNFDMAAYLAGSNKKEGGNSGNNGGGSSKNQGVRR
ncbi:hypothetical protein NW754_012303 [Fusarium falciforme]|nr:hypothetical protein NW754_012303 [Fusarium falciforme]